MDKLSPVVLESFGLSSKGIKKEKGHYLCNSVDGPVKVHITSQTPEAIRKQHSLKEYLAESFPHTDRFRLTKDRQPFIMIGRETYVATPYPMPQAETSLDNDENVLEAVHALARLHLASCKMPKIGLPMSPPLPEIYTRKLNGLVQESKQARRGQRMSDFDVAFIKHIPRATDTIKDALARLEKTNYSLAYNQAISQNSLCHNALKEENLPVVNGTTYIINFTQATFDLQLSDLGALIRRYAQRSSKGIPASSLMAAYDSVNPLPEFAKDIIYPQLTFPWSFTKLATQYYSKKRNWTPNGLINSMEAVLTEWDSYERYIKDIL
ncbi:MAG: hypothetical protein FWC73_12000 [Defluviitaleaceae bacterium]|nr:hypothetical protein [Defluviitaleaceae bacterium]